MSDQCFVQEADLDIDRFRKICDQQTDLSDYPLASEIRHDVVIYDAQAFDRAIGSVEAETELKSELHRCLLDGPGVLAVRNAFANSDIVDDATAVYRTIIADERSTAEHRGDHFARPGENERIWNALQKLCERAPETFVNYYSNPVLGLVSESWLGPNYQVTSQVNIVKPGGAAQQAHRDYHLGFQNNSVVARYPVSVQVASQFLTLQGAVAHTDMSIASGPTKVLPYSQQYAAGYLAWRDHRFRSYYEQQCIQIPLKKGDAIFFSPALFHSAGSNTETTDRVANLLQVSVAFGKTMESVDWTRIAQLAYAVLLKKQRQSVLSTNDVRWLMGSTADGYAFPTNLDTDPPVEESAPMNAQELLQQSLEDELTVDEFTMLLTETIGRRRA